MVGAKVPISSNFNSAKWRGYLQEYTDNLVLDSLEFGWPLNFQGDFLPESTFRNHPSGIKHSPVLTDYVTKELSMQSIIGPFSCNPFEVPCVISPLIVFLKSKTHQLNLKDVIKLNRNLR